MRGMVAQMRTTGGEHRFESSDEDAVVRLLASGHSVGVVAFALGMPTRKVRRIARRHGIRPSGTE